MSYRLVKFISLGAMVAVAAAANAQSFQSGNGTVGGTDSLISVMAGPASSDFATFTSSTFTNFASNSNAAVILPSIANGWVSGLGGGSTAEWVGISSTGGNNSFSSNSGLYAISFSEAKAVSGANLNLLFSVDDQLGGSNNVGIYIDGNAIAGSSSGVLWDGSVQDSNYSLGALSAGTHTLYFDVVNSGSGPSGIIFQGNVQAVPEPTPYAALGLGLIGLVRRRRAKKA